MNKNTDAVPAGVAALYADIISHPAEEWKASGSDLPYLEWVEEMKSREKLDKFSVLLGYPDGQTFFTWVSARSAVAAVEKAKKRCVENYSGEEDDLTPVLVLAGHHDCLLAKEDFA
jgi:hypothetical protein